MRTTQRTNPWESSTTRTGLVIAVAIHVAIITAVLGTWRLRNFTAGDDSMDGSGDSAPLGGKPVHSDWKTHTLLIEDESETPLASARVHLLLGDSIKVT